MTTLPTATRRFPGTPLVAAAHWLDRPAVVGDDPGWTWRRVHAASIALADRLEGATLAGNLCHSRVGFLVTWLAALRRGCVQWLPPSGGQAELAMMVSAGGDCRVIVDGPDTWRQPPGAEPVPCLMFDPSAPSRGVPDSELAWSPDWDAPRVRLFTSGSSGTPEPHSKSLGQLVSGAKVLAERLDTTVDGGIAALGRIVCSVPPQHMFGLEASVMLSLVVGLPVLDRRPLLPADVLAAIDSHADAAIWVATPLHLRALVQAGDPVAHCGAVITSTMPLAPAQAARAEGLLGAPVLEIYGSTETGALAMRRTACDAGWQPLQGVRLQSTADGTQACGAHFSSPQTLNDRIELGDSGQFTLLGRHGDLVKIAGRRASLAGLNLLLSDLPGLLDGVLYLPATGAPTERLVLIHAGPALDRAAAEAWLRERIDPVFLPRTVIRVDRLPRAASGKLPRVALDEVYSAWQASKAPR